MRITEIVPWLLAGLPLLSCADPAGVLPLDAETRALRATEARAAAQLEAAYGESARVQRIFGVGPRVLVGVATEEAVPDSDVVPPVAIAAWDEAKGALEPVTEAADYREALSLGERTALVTSRGELVLRDEDGTERILAGGVRGDLAYAADGERLAFTLGAPNREHETAVAVSDLEGNVTVLADAPGVDDRPALSPDGNTVVFVSGRTGVASFYRTTLEGAPPVQLTNVGIALGVPRKGPPPGFVPPPVVGDRVQWLSDDVIRYDAGGGELWTLDIRTGAGAREGGAK